MNYQEIYNKIIKRRIENPLDTYTEKHHIEPRSLGGSDERENLVKLSAREHYICHLLLTKIYNSGNEHSKMIYAFMMMCNAKNELQKRDFKNNSRLYERRKLEYSQIMSKKMSSENKKYMWIYNPVLKISKRVPKETELDEGWVKGRVIHWELFGDKLKECKYCKNLKPIPGHNKFCSKECKERYNQEKSFLFKNKERFKTFYKETENLSKTFNLLGKNGIGSHLYRVLKIIKEDPELLEIYNKHKYKDIDLI